MNNSELFGLSHRPARAKGVASGRASRRTRRRRPGMRDVAACRARPPASAPSTSGRVARPRPRRGDRARRRVALDETLVAFPGAWYGPDARARSSEWTIELTDADVREIDDALASVKARGISDITELGPENFVLPTLGARLVRLWRELVHGRGFALMRRFPVHRYTNWDACAAFYALGRYMGTCVPQNKIGNVVGHVKDLGGDPKDPLTRLYTTSAAQPYHTDSADIVGLLCLSQATEGGHSQVTSSVAIWNELVARHPESARTLREPFVVSRKGEIPAGKQATYLMPVFHTHEGRLSAIYDRSFIDSAVALTGVPLTQEQTTALDHLDALACSDALRLDMTLEPGDIQWLHNHTTLHARSAFKNVGAKPRHLVRLWVSPNEDVGAMPLPEIFAERFGTIVPGPMRGGIRVDGQVLTCPTDAVRP